jgi:hypothetical protein
MTLPRSGELGLRSINQELGRSASAQISLDTAENGGYGAINTFSTSRPNSANPAAISEWYGYNHQARGAVFSCTFSAGSQLTGPGTISGNNTNANGTALLGAYVFGGTGSRSGCESYFYINGRIIIDLFAQSGEETAAVGPDVYAPGTRTYQITAFTGNGNSISRYECSQV